MKNGIRGGLFGTVTLRVTGSFVERFLNLVARRGLPVWDIVRAGESEVVLSTTPAGFRRMRQAAYRAGVRIQVQEKRGLPFRLQRVKHRNALFAGLLLFLLLTVASTQFLWDITLEGCEELEPRYVLEVLEGLGVKKGACIRGLALEDIHIQARLDIQELSFIAINIRGTTADIQVRERISTPELLSPTGVRDLVAAQDGQIERMEVYNGLAMVRVGDTVQKGDLLVSGAFTTTSDQLHTVAADARITLRTWKTGRIEAPRVAQTKQLTGKQVVRHALMLPGFSIKMYGNSGISMLDYVTLSKEQALRLPFGIELPIGLRTEVICEQITLTQLLSDEELAQRCLGKLDAVVSSLSVLEVLEVTHELELSGEGAGLWFEITCLENAVDVVELS